ncbi:MAG: MarR family transcriptional regulator [Cyclobacteriaceae bacterium]|nr:MarR family transcriptional regulator [Cyclobacteriaceae bacterium]
MNIEEEIKQKSFLSEYHKLAINLLFTSKWLEASQSRIFKSYDISPQQYNVLRILRGQYPNACNLLLIRDRMLDKSSNASRLIDKLEKSGLSQRRICPNNRRQVDITITEKGLSMLELIAPKLDEMNRTMKKISVEEAQTLNGLLDKLRG